MKKKLRTKRHEKTENEIFEFATNYDIDCIWRIMLISSFI